MPEAQLTQAELPNIVTILADKFKGGILSHFLFFWENVIFSFIIICILCLITYFATRKFSSIPGRLQNLVEIFVSGIDDFICGILGKKGRRFTPFIGTLFIYIFFMNLFGIVPFMKSPTTSWSTTLGLALCVFVYVQYSALKELGFLGYIDHLMERPRGLLAFTVVIPVLLFCLHLVAELIKPISLSLRLRSNIWGDDMLLAVMAGFGIRGIPLLLFNTLLAILAGVVQAVVFCLLSTIYFALFLTEEELVD